MQLQAHLNEPGPIDFWNGPYQLPQFQNYLPFWGDIGMLRANSELLLRSWSNIRAGVVALGRKDDASWNLMIALALVVLIHFEPWKLALPLIRSSFSFVWF